MTLEHQLPHVLRTPHGLQTNIGPTPTKSLKPGTANVAMNDWPSSAPDRALSPGSLPSSPPSAAPLTSQTSSASDGSSRLEPWHLYGFEVHECPEPEWASCYESAILGALPMFKSASDSVDNGVISRTPPYLHPFGALFRCPIPSHALPAFSVWLGQREGGSGGHRHALVTLRHLGIMLPGLGQSPGGRATQTRETISERFGQNLGPQVPVDLSPVTVLAVAHRVMATMMRRESFEASPWERLVLGGKDEAAAASASGGSNDQGIASKRSPSPPHDARLSWTLDAACRKWSESAGLAFLKRALLSIRDEDLHGNLLKNGQARENHRDNMSSSAAQPPRSHPIENDQDLGLGANAWPPDLQGLPPAPEEGMWYISVPLVSGGAPLCPQLLSSSYSPSLLQSGRSHISLPIPETFGELAASDASGWVDWDLLRSVAQGAIPVQNLVDLGPFTLPLGLGGDAGASCNDADRNCQQVGLLSKPACAFPPSPGLEGRVLFRATGRARRCYLSCGRWDPERLVTTLEDAHPASLRMQRALSSEPAAVGMMPTRLSIAAGISSTGGPGLNPMSRTMDDCSPTPIGLPVSVTFTHRQALMFNSPELPLELVPLGAPLLDVDRFSWGEGIGRMGRSRRRRFKRNLLKRTLEGGVGDTGSPEAAPKASGASELLLPCSLLAHPLPLSSWVALQQLPSLVRRIESMLTAEEVRREILDSNG